MLVLALTLLVALLGGYALVHLPITGIEAHSDRLAVQCRREAKMQVLETLTRLDGMVLDLHVREPSLEDVFFGFSD